MSDSFHTLVGQSCHESEARSLLEFVMPCRTESRHGVCCAPVYMQIGDLWLLFSYTLVLSGLHGMRVLLQSDSLSF